MMVTSSLGRSGEAFGSSALGAVSSSGGEAGASALTGPKVSREGLSDSSSIFAWRVVRGESSRAFGTGGPPSLGHGPQNCARDDSMLTQRQQKRLYTL